MLEKNIKSRSPLKFDYMLFNFSIYWNYYTTALQETCNEWKNAKKDKNKD